MDLARTAAALDAARLKEKSRGAQNEPLVVASSRRSFQPFAVVFLPMVEPSRRIPLRAAVETHLPTCRRIPFGAQAIRGPGGRLPGETASTVQLAAVPRGSIVRAGEAVPLDRRVGHRRLRVRHPEDPRDSPPGLELAALVHRQRRVLDDERLPAPVVAHEEDGSAPFSLAVLPVYAHPAEGQRVRVAVVCRWRPRCPRLGVPDWAGLAPSPIALLSTKRLLRTVYETPMPLEPAAVGAGAAEARGAAEGAVHDVDRVVVVLAEQSSGRRRRRGPGRWGRRRCGRTFPRAHHLELAAPNEDGAAAAALLELARGVAVDEGEVLYGEGRGVLVLAVAGGPHLGLALLRQVSW